MRMDGSHSLCLLFRYMAVDRPSVKLLSFLRKHYGLANNIPQVSLSLLLLVRLLPFLFSDWMTLLFFSLVSLPFLIRKSAVWLVKKRRVLRTMSFGLWPTIFLVGTRCRKHILKNLCIQAELTSNCSCFVLGFLLCPGQLHASYN